jgi:hypothetical protein
MYLIIYQDGAVKNTSTRLLGEEKGSKKPCSFLDHWKDSYRKTTGNKYREENSI